MLFQPTICTINVHPGILPVLAICFGRRSQRRGTCPTLLGPPVPRADVSNGSRHT